MYRDHLFRPLDETCACGKPDCECDCGKNGIDAEVGMGVMKSDGNHLFKIPVNNFDSSDATFVGDGETAETSKQNIPAIIAAMNTGAMPHPLTTANGINKPNNKNMFKLAPEEE